MLRLSLEFDAANLSSWVPFDYQDIHRSRQPGRLKLGKVVEEPRRCLSLPVHGERQRSVSSVPTTNRLLLTTTTGSILSSSPPPSSAPRRTGPKSRPCPPASTSTTKVESSASRRASACSVPTPAIPASTLTSGGTTSCQGGQRPATRNSSGSEYYSADFHPSRPY